MDDADGGGDGRGWWEEDDDGVAETEDAVGNGAMVFLVLSSSRDGMALIFISLRSVHLNY